MAQTLTSGQGIDRRQAIALGAAAAAGAASSSAPVVPMPLLLFTI